MNVSPYILVFEALMVTFLGLALLDALRRGPERVAALLVGVVFGILLEWGTIEQLQAYSYGRFAMMLGPVPLSVGIGWGVIAYSARLASDATDLPEWARPLLDGFFALGLDLAMDVVAIRIGMWDWGEGLGFEYFGVPWGNFWAWFWVVSSFSAGTRLCRRAGVWAPLGGMFIGLVTVGTTNWLLVDCIPAPLHPVMVLLQVGLAAVLVFSRRPRRVLPLPWLARAVPVTSHVFFLGVGLLSGALFDPPALAGLAVVVVAAYAWMFRR